MWVSGMSEASAANPDEAAGGRPRSDNWVLADGNRRTFGIPTDERDKLFRHSRQHTFRNSLNGVDSARLNWPYVGPARLTFMRAKRAGIATGSSRRSAQPRIFN
jgi:hypothetical protein